MLFWPMTANPLLSIGIVFGRMGVSQVAERALFLWNNEHLVTAGVLSLQYPNPLLPVIYGPLRERSTRHWNSTVEGLAHNVLRMYNEQDPGAYERWGFYHPNTSPEVSPIHFGVLIVGDGCGGSWDDLVHESDCNRVLSCLERRENSDTRKWLEFDCLWYSYLDLVMLVPR